MIGQVFAGGPSPLVTLPMVFLVVATVGAPGRAAATSGSGPRRGWWPARWSLQGVAIGLLIVAADAAVGQEGVAPFIYFQF